MALGDKLVQTGMSSTHYGMGYGANAAMGGSNSRVAMVRKYVLGRMHVINDAWMRAT